MISFSNFIICFMNYTNVIKVFLLMLSFPLGAWGGDVDSADEDLPELSLSEAMLANRREGPILCMQSRMFSEILNGDAFEVQRLIELGADVATMNYFGEETVLHAAARVGGADVLQVLLNAGAPLDQVNFRGETPLHYAAARGYYVAVVALLRAGAAVDVLDSEGRTASDLAGSAGYQGVTGVIASFRLNPGARAEHLDTVEPEQSCFEAFLDAYFGGC